MTPTEEKMSRIHPVKKVVKKERCEFCKDFILDEEMWVAKWRVFEGCSDEPSYIKRSFYCCTRCSSTEIGAKWIFANSPKFS